jgi:hypothetical protein
MMATLPRPDVTVGRPCPPEGCTPSDTAVEVVITRDNKCKSYTADGATRDEATGKVIREILDDPKSIEWLP